MQRQTLGLLSPWPSLHKRRWAGDSLLLPGTTYTASKHLLSTRSRDGLKTDLPDLFSSHIRRFSIMQAISLWV